MKGRLTKLPWYVAFTAYGLLFPSIQANEVEDDFAVAAAHYRESRWELARQAFAEFCRKYGSDPRVGDAQFFQAEACVQIEEYVAARELYARLSETTTPRREVILFRQGEIAYLLQDYSSAIEHLNLFADEYPHSGDFPRALVYTADAAFAQGNLELAREKYQQCLDSAPAGPLKASCLLGLAEVNRKTGEYEIAREFIAKAQSLLTSSIEKLEATILLARLDLAQGQALAAIERLEPLELEQLDRVGAAKLLLGKAYRVAEQYEDAQTVLSELTSHQEYKAFAWYELGLCAIAQQEWLEAEGALAKCMQDVPVGLRHNAGLSRVRALRQLQEWKSARELLATLERAEDISPTARVAVRKAELRLAIAANDAQGAKQLLQQEDRADSVLLQDTDLLAQLAQLHLRNEDYSEAASVLRQMLQLNEGSELTRWTLAHIAKSHLLASEYEAAELAADQLLAGNEFTDPGMKLALQVAETAYGQSQYRLARTIYDRLATLQPSDSIAASVAMGFGWLALQDHTIEEAIAQFQQVAEQYPSTQTAAQAALVAAQLLEQQSDWDAAIAMYESAVRQSPDVLSVQERAQFLLARVHDRLHHNREAEQGYENYLAKFPNASSAAEALLHLGWVKKSTQTVAAANNTWITLTERFPESVEAHQARYLLAEHAANEGQWQQASDYLQALKPLIESSPAEPESQEKNSELIEKAQYLQATLAIRQKQWPQAIELLQRYLSTNGKHPRRHEARYWLAEAHFRLQQLPEAEEHFTTLQSTMGPQEAELMPFLLLRQGQLAAHQSQWQEAKRAAQQVLDYETSSSLAVEAHYLLGRSHSAQGAMQDARNAYQQTIVADEGRHSETAAMAQWMIGESLLHEQQTERALRAFLRVDILYPQTDWKARSLLQAGKCYEILNQPDEAARLYRRALELEPESSVARDLQARLAYVAKIRTGKALTEPVRQ